MNCINCGASKFNKNKCVYCGTEIIEEIKSIPLKLKVSGMDCRITIRKGKNFTKDLKISGMSVEDELICESLDLKISGMSCVVKIEKDIQIINKKITGMNSKIKII